MVTSEFLLLSAFVLDLIFGDPRCMPHPVRGIGWLALQTEELLRRTAQPLLLAGILAVLVVVGGSAGIAGLLVE